jgi:hypothetical protein
MALMRPSLVPNRDDVSAGYSAERNDFGAHLAPFRVFFSPPEKRILSGASPRRMKNARILSSAPVKARTFATSMPSIIERLTVSSDRSLVVRYSMDDTKVNKRSTDLAEGP